MRILLCVLSLVFISSCGLLKIHHVNTSVIPADFEYNNSTLLVEELPRAQRANKKINKLLDKKYKHIHEMVQSRDIFHPSGKYADSTKYRFAIVHSLGENTTLRDDVIHNMQLPKTYTIIDYNAYDRLQKKHHKKTEWPASFAALPFETLLNTLVKAEKERKK